MVIRFGGLVRRTGQRWSLARGGFKSLTAHAADPDSNLTVTLTTEGLFQFW